VRDEGAKRKTMGQEGQVPGIGNHTSLLIGPILHAGNDTFSLAGQRFARKDLKQ
jgi:hypothetical protein